VGFPKAAADDRVILEPLADTGRCVCKNVEIRGATWDIDVERLDMRL
jgi:hypothetical protein